MSVLFQRMSEFPATALSKNGQAHSQLKTLFALVYRYPNLTQVGDVAELTNCYAEMANKHLGAIIDKGWAFRIDHPEVSRYWYYPNLSRVIQTLGINSIDAIWKETERENDQFVSNIANELEAMAQRKQDREERARIRAKGPAQAIAFADGSTGSATVATAVEEPSRENAPTQYDYAWCGVGGIIASLDDQGLPTAIRIIETKF